ncbi:ABC-three component system middle component 1 [Virgibacillus flavescens]|uniref:ABC-three component system middle component 1 n=1 Tax=Virgibacillus flavescens TaxID=1611422 RepID=UPI003D33ED37
MKYSHIIEWLRQNNFKVEQSEEFYPDYFFCKKDQINVIVKEYTDKELSSQVRSDAVDVRTVLNKNGENIWNTYFFICKKSEEMNIPYSLEKDSIGLRKYVINSPEDFKRIPFLDQENSYSSESEASIKLPRINNSQKLEKVVERIISIDGLQRELDSNDLESILIDLYEMEVINDEN